ncbi:hypothetical protein CGLO_18216 [Colletotrichum gloeosporioides Cg-14]|uniref:Methylisocitrate lyase n=1 Tax=Colletotrichum gloeosporioides (strain Cg-14) TaxID=1237896 RepID=T0KV39_COLGC|nr:hypothetical protein CGLO_18216 [Colletotrichum gloeosporioides Cg-14]
MAEKAKEMIRASQLPLLVDMDTGYGGLFKLKISKCRKNAGI